jgi:hypothetical protein
VQTEEAVIPFEGQQFKIIAGDTPGLKDAKTQEKCGEEIRKALEKSKDSNSALRLIFFFTLEGGRVDPDDVATMQTVLGAIKSSTDMTNQFGVVINKIPELEYEWIMEEQVKQTEIIDCVFPPGTTKSAHVYWNAQDQPMATAALRAQRARESGRPVSAAPTIPQGPSVEKLRDFIMKLPALSIEKVEKLETDKLKELREETKKAVEAMEAENAKQRAELQALMGKAEEAETIAAEERRRNATLLEELRLKNEEVARQILEADENQKEALRIQQIEYQHQVRIAKEAAEAATAKAEEAAGEAAAAQAASQARIGKMAQDRRAAEAEAEAKRPTWMGNIAKGGVLLGCVVGAAFCAPAEIVVCSGIAAVTVGSYAVDKALGRETQFQK